MATNSPPGRPAEAGKMPGGCFSGSWTRIDYHVPPRCSSTPPLDRSHPVQLFAIRLPRRAPTQVFPEALMASTCLDFRRATLLITFLDAERQIAASTSMSITLPHPCKPIPQPYAHNTHATTYFSHLCILAKLTITHE